MRTKVLATVALLLGILLVSSVALAGFPTDELGVGSSETWVMNVHETLDANVVATYVDQDGNQAGSIQSTISPQGNDNFPASSSSLSSGWLGSMTIDSLRPIASVVENTYEDVPGGDHWSASAYCDTPEGAHEIFLGLVKTGYYRSRFTIHCLATADCQVSMTYRNAYGNAVSGSPFLDTIQSFSQETYDLWDASVNPNIPNDSQMPSGWSGTLQVTSTQLIAGVAHTHCASGHASSCNAIPRTTATEVFFPGFARRNFGGSWGGQSDWSGVSIHNLSDFSITIYLNFYKANGTRVLRFSDDVPAYGTNGYNARYGDNWPSYLLESPFSGSLVVTSTHPIIGSHGVMRAPSYGLSAAYAGASSGSQKLVLPVAYRVKDGSDWREYTGICIQNLDPDNEITVHLQWFDSDGNLLLKFEDESIAPYAAHGYNTRYGDEGTYGDLGTNWKGTVVVTTTNPVGIAGVLLNTTSMPHYVYITEYNGIPVE